MSRLFLVLGLSLSLAQIARAQSAPFDVVDLTGTIAGEPQVTLDSARKSWNNACRDWKTETKEINRNNELLGINCNTPVCSSTDGRNQCTSTGTYQVKTAGTRVSAPPPQAVAAPAPAPTTEVVTVQQPPVSQVIVEQPAPSVGVIWVPGYWGWVGHRHVWHNGYWRHPVHYGWRRF